MTIKVYHLNSLTSEERNRLNGSDGGWDSEPRFSRYANITSGFSKKFALNVGFALSAGEYHEAAVVTVPARRVGVSSELEYAFEVTNHIESDWAENDGVEALTEKRKSSSVGDVFERDGSFYIVAPMGFEKIDFDASEIGSLKGLI